MNGGARAAECLNPALYDLKRSEIREFSRLAAGTPGCISLTLGEPCFDTPLPVREAAITALDLGETRYTDNRGTAALRERIARHERERNGVSYSADEIIVTIGATEALWCAMFGTLDAGDEVIIPSPAFVLYEQIARLCRAVPIALNTAPNRFQIDEAALSAVITPRTRAIVLNSPNNPTGAVLNADSLEAVRQAVLGAASRGQTIFVICDDVYRALTYGADYHSFSEFTELRDRIIVVQSFSKPYAMTGWRAGWLMSDAPVIDRLALLHQFTVVSAPTPFMRACEAALDCDISPMISAYRDRRELAMARLSEMRLDFVPPDGTFYIFPSIENLGMSSADFCRRMIAEAGVAATPGSCFGGEGHVRISFSAEPDTLEEGLARMGRFVRALREGRDP